MVVHNPFLNFFRWYILAFILYFRIKKLLTELLDIWTINNEDIDPLNQQNIDQSLQAISAASQEINARAEQLQSEYLVQVDRCPFTEAVSLTQEYGYPSISDDLIGPAIISIPENNDPEKRISISNSNSIYRKSSSRW